MYNPAAQNPKDYENSRTAILFNYDNYWNTNLHPQTYQWDFAKYLTTIYAAIKALRVPVDFVSEDADFSRYKMIVAPAYQLVDKQLIGKMLKYVENGGNLVLTCRTGQKDRNGHLWEASWAAPVDTLIGGKVSFFDILPSNKTGKIRFNNKEFLWNDWADVLEMNKGTEALATYSSFYYAGKPAVTYRKLGKGAVTYIGPATDSGKFEQEVFQQVYSRAKLKTVLLPEGLILEYRNGFGIAINYNSMELNVPLPSNAEIVFGQPILKPAEVIVWVEKTR